VKSFLYSFKLKLTGYYYYQVFCAIIRGPLSAREMMTGVASNPRNETMARKHHIRNITPGAIAATAIFVCFKPLYIFSETNFNIN